MQKSHPCGWKEHISASGVTYFTDKYDEDASVPRIPEDVLNSTVYIYCNAEDAEQGARIGGTGFIVAVDDIETDPYGRQMPIRNTHLYVVTNWHVISSVGETPVVRLNRKAGNSDILTTLQDSWMKHPGGDDLAIRPITLSADTHQYTSINTSRFLNRANSFEIGPGMDVFMVGRFISHDGKQRNLPSVRFGNIAMMPLEPIAHPMGFDQESFMVETRSLSGYSGSPVFSYIPPGAVYWGSRSPRIRRADAPLQPEEMRFIGVDWGHLPIYEPILIAKTQPHPGDLWVRSNSGMCGVVPAWKLTELLYSEEAKMQRERDNKELNQRRKNENTAVLDVAAKSNSQPLFTKENFEDALTKVSRKKSVESE